MALGRRVGKNPVSQEVAVTATWQEVEFRGNPRNILLANVSAAPGTIRFKWVDDFEDDQGGALVQGEPRAIRTISEVTANRVLFRSGDANQTIYVEYHLW